MPNSTSRPSKPFRASESEQASIRALKNWLLSAPPENALEDQIVRQRLAAAIAFLAEGQDRPHIEPKPEPGFKRDPEKIPPGEAG